MPATETAAVTKSETEAGAGGKTTVGAGTDLEYPTLLQTIVVRDGDSALKWYEKALGGEVAYRYNDAEGKVMHAIVKTDYGLMVGVEDYYPKMHMVTPNGEGEGVRGCTYVYVTIPRGKGSADEAVERMREAGGEVFKECSDMFYGQRMGQVKDIYGVAWVFAHKIEKKEKEDNGQPEKEE